VHEFLCLINKTHKKISYPQPTIVEGMFHSNLPPLSLIIDEIKSGEIMIVEMGFKKPMRVFVVQDESLFQIYGEPMNFFNVVEIECFGFTKKTKIEQFIFELFSQFSLNEMISYKNDFKDFENNIFKFLLLIKNANQYDNKKLRSLSFKSFKNPHLAEKMCKLLMKKKFNYFELTKTQVKVDFVNLNVQFKHD